jgi:hypothetical protein
VSTAFRSLRTGIAETMTAAAGSTVKYESLTAMLTLPKVTDLALTGAYRVK